MGATTDDALTVEAVRSVVAILRDHGLGKSARTVEALDSALVLAIGQRDEARLAVEREREALTGWQEEARRLEADLLRQEDQASVLRHALTARDAEVARLTAALADARAGAWREGAGAERAATLDKLRRNATREAILTASRAGGSGYIPSDREAGFIGRGFVLMAEAIEALPLPPLPGATGGEAGIATLEPLLRAGAEAARAEAARVRADTSRSEPEWCAAADGLRGLSGDLYAAANAIRDLSPTPTKEARDGR